MRIHLAWIRVTAIAAIAAGASAHPAAAQYVPYRQMPPQAATPVQPTAAQPVQPTAQAPYTAYWQQLPQTAPQQAAPVPYRAPAVAQYPQTTAPYVPTTTAPATAANPQPSAQYPNYPTYPYVAYQPNQAAPAAPEDDGTPAPKRNDAPANGYEMQNGQTTPANGLNGYPQSCNCSGGYTNGYPTSGYGGASCGTTHSDFSLRSYFDNPSYDSQWFGGVYFLYMERDRPSPVKLTVEVDHAVAPDPYYPAADRTVLVQSDHDFRAGVEVRFGSTFTIGDSCDTCDTGCNGGCNGCAPCNPSVYAWEVAWWGIDDDANDVTFVDQPTTRIYGMRNFVGLEYDRDAGGVYAYRPVNEYYDYQLPIPDPGPAPYPDGYVSVLAQRVRTNFKAQNLELNILRFPVCDVACGGCNGGCNTGCDAGCNSGCYGDYGACGCEEQCCPSTFSMYGSCGVRYFRADDDFLYATEFTEWSGGAADQAGYNGWNYDNSNELFYDVQVENHLVGPQVGWSMNYCYASKWNFFCNSTFGIFNNHINSVQQMWTGGDGAVRFSGDGSTFYVSSSKNDVSFLSELRLGGSYDITCHWRAVAAYRAVAITGIANSTDQIPDEFTNKEWVAIIDSDSSMIVHGVQVGAECRY